MSVRYDEDFVAAFGGHDRGDLAFFRALAEASRGSICEIGAGTGRVVLHLAATLGPRRRLVAVEPSAGMRARLAAKVVAAGHTHLAVAAGTFAALPLASRSQGLAYAAFRSFQHVLTPADQLAALAEMKRVLRPGALMAIDLFDPAYPLLRRARPTLGFVYRSARGTRVERWESRAVDRVAQRVDVTFRWLERADDGTLVSDSSATYAVRYTFPVELEHLVARAGFVDVELRGGYDGRPLTKTPRELVLVARKPRAGSPYARGARKRAGSNATR